MKYQSGIQKDINGNIFILFGGSIGVRDVGTDDYECEACGIRLQAMKNNFNIGATVAGENAEKVGPSINLLFNKPESIDVIISHLQNVKKMLEEQK